MYVDQSTILDYVRHLLSLFEMAQSLQNLVAGRIAHPVKQSVIPLDILARLLMGSQCVWCNINQSINICRVIQTIRHKVA